MIRMLLVIALWMLADPAAAATIYKCRQAGGVVSYQDSPCPGRQIGVLRTPTTAAQANRPVKSPPTPQTPPVAPGSAGSTPDQPARPTPTGRAPRPSFKCIRPDGSYYYTGDARPRRTLVDLDDAKAFVGAIPGAPAPPPGKAWAQDQCSTATRSDSCQYYREQIAHVDAQQQSAKGDAVRRLTREGQRLRAIYNHRCT
jgi:hypothetical protein